MNPGVLKVTECRPEPAYSIIGPDGHGLYVVQRYDGKIMSDGPSGLSEAKRLSDLLNRHSGLGIVPHGQDDPPWESPACPEIYTEETKRKRSLALVEAIIKSTSKNIVLDEIIGMAEDRKAELRPEEKPFRMPEDEFLTQRQREREWAGMETK